MTGIPSLTMTDREKQQIYSLRTERGRKRQPRHSAYIEKLESALKNMLKKKIPYGLSYKEKEDLQTIVPEFFHGGQGNPAQLPSVPYLYRLCSITDIIFNAKLRLHDSETKDEALAWENLFMKSRGEGSLPVGERMPLDEQLSKGVQKWLKLSEHGEGMYFGCNNVSWWTDYSLPADVVLGALKVGMFTNWVARRSVLLRCPVSAIKDSDIARVPTVIDAYCHLVFHPTTELKNPAAGKTIDLSEPLNFCTAQAEFILKPLETAHLDFLPVAVTRTEKSRFRGHNEFNPEMLRGLIGYYETL